MHAEAKRNSSLTISIFVTSSGRYDEAAALYRKIIKKNSRHFHALHSLGIIEAAKGNLKEAASLIINAAVRLRKVIDEQVRCAPTDVFIALPRGERGTEILKYIRQELPNVSVLGWEFELDGPKIRVRRSGLPQERLVTFMIHRKPGRTYMSQISQEFGLKPYEKKDLQKVLRDENHATTLALTAVGVTYGSEGKGRGAKSFL
jgi:tetratricopeptide (TPR) repeat protein